jgi:FixJ family two-component response regulator
VKFGPGVLADNRIAVARQKGAIVPSGKLTGTKVDNLGKQFALIAQDNSIVDSTLRVARKNSWGMQHFETCEMWLSHVTSGLSSNGDATLPLQPGCVVIQATMSGHELPSDVARVCCLRASLPVVILTRTPTTKGVVAAMRAGANNLIEFPCSDGQFEQVIREALDSAISMYSKVVRTLQSKSRLSKLNANEQAVLDNLLEGLSNKAIAATLQIGLRTVELRRAQILQKMGAKNLAELVRLVCETR